MAYNSKLLADVIWWNTCLFYGRSLFSLWYIYLTSYLTCLNLILLCSWSYFSTYRICLSNTYIFIFLQVLTEYILVSVTSAVTVTIAGVVKEAVTILVSINFYIIYIFFYDWSSGWPIIILNLMFWFHAVLCVGCGIILS